MSCICISDITCLTDAEQRILLAMIDREKRICRETDKNGDPGLAKIMDSLERKIREAFVALEKQEQRTDLCKDSEQIRPAKLIHCCGECAYYSHSKHRCTRGATDEGKPQDKFYADCPLDDLEAVAEKISGK